MACTRRDMLTGSGFPAVNGWCATSAASHVLEEPRVQKWSSCLLQRPTRNRLITRSHTCYDAVEVTLDAVRRLAKSGKPMTRDNVRAAMLQTKAKLVQGEVSFNRYGDLASTAVSIFQVRYDPKYPMADVTHQFRYIGTAPTA